jgi:hypothetical protein
MSTAAPLPLLEEGTLLGDRDWVEPHKSSHTAAALDANSHRAVETVRVEATLPEYRPLLSWAKRFTERRWAVENAGGLGRHLAQWLIARGETGSPAPTGRAIGCPARATGN